MYLKKLAVRISVVSDIIIIWVVGSYLFVASVIIIIWVVGSYLFVASVSGCITGYTDLCGV